MSSYFQYTPAAYSPSTPSPTGRLDTTWSGGIGTLDVGRIPIQGGAKRRYKRSYKRSQKRQRKQQQKQHKKTQRKQRK
jgi:hypothetical protein